MTRGEERRGEERRGEESLGTNWLRGSTVAQIVRFYLERESKRFGIVRGTSDSGRGTKKSSQFVLRPSSRAGTSGSFCNRIVAASSGL